jgi:hypothetical protein
MKRKSEKTKHAFWNPNSKVLAAAGILCTALGSLMVVSEGYALPFIAGAEVFEITRDSSDDVLFDAGENIGPPSSAVVGDTLKIPGQSLILLAGSESFAWIRGVSFTNESIGPTVLARSSTSTDGDVHYFYPCRGYYGSNAEALISWEPEGPGGNRGCMPPGVRIGSDERLVRVFHDAPENPESPDQASLQKHFFQAQLPFPGGNLLDQIRVRYCSAVSVSGDAWAVSSTGGFGLWDAQNPCQTAQEKCRAESDGSSDCVVASWGAWSINQPELVVSLDCANNRSFTGKGGGAAIVTTLMLETIGSAESLGANSCVLSIYPPNELIVAPDTDEFVLVQVRNLNNQAMVVDAIAGDIRIKSSQNPAGIAVPEGRTYTLRDEQNTPEIITRRYTSGTTSIGQSAALSSSVIQSLLEGQSNLPQDPAERAALVSQEFQQVVDAAESNQDFQEPTPAPERPTPEQPTPEQPTPEEEEPILL